ncbi:MAG: penicillin-insensitive murein endopeptidase [Erythrobacter sp.]|nr:penicillin-insensitive murein endopeptidase [Erythrobacter sp.]
MNFSLVKGSKGTPVLWLQDAINRSLGRALSLDGDFGPGTEQAVLDYQSANALAVDGQAGRRTFQALGLDFGAIRKNGSLNTVCWLLPASGDGYVTYNRDGNDQFGTEDTVARMQRYLAQFTRDTGTTAEIGNISRYRGGRHHPHSSHRNGQQVDIRPLRHDGQTGTRLTFRSSAYSRGKTQALVDIIRADSEGVSILFNDPDVRGVRSFAGHNDHLHVSFSRVASKYKMSEDQLARSLAETPLSQA